MSECWYYTLRYWNVMIYMYLCRNVKTMAANPDVIWMYSEGINTILLPLLFPLQHKITGDISLFICYLSCFMLAFMLITHAVGLNGFVSLNWFKRKMPSNCLCISPYLLDNLFIDIWWNYLLAVFGFESTHTLSCPLSAYRCQTFSITCK